MSIGALRSAGAGVLISSAILGTAHADPSGLWRASDGGLTRISPCGAAFCGYIVSVVPANDPATDKNNPDPAKQNRPLVGLQVLINMRAEGPGRWTGQLYDADRGQSFPGHLIEVDGNTVRVEGCALGICDGENMTRVQSKSR